MKEIYYLTGPETAHGGPHGKNSNGARREWGPVGKCLFWGFKVEWTGKAIRGFHWCIWMSLGHRQGKRGRGASDRDHPYHTDAPSCLDVVLTDCSWGMLRHQEIRRFKESQCTRFVSSFKGLFKPYYENMSWVLAFLVLLTCRFSALRFLRADILFACFFCSIISPSKNECYMRKGWFYVLCIAFFFKLPEV